MPRSKSLASGLLSLSAAAVLALNGAGGAVAAPTANDGGAEAPVTAHIVTDGGSADYWTPERMRSAANGEILAGKALQRSQNHGSAVEPVERGKASAVPGLLPAEGKASQDPTASRKGSGETVVPHVGKVFFTLGGTNYVCSGNSVASGNKSTVSTAGHCLHEAPGSFASNFIFVPAYKDGAAPYGKWTAKALYAPTEWINNGNMQYDTGFAVVDSQGSTLLADVVGASGVQFNVQRGLTYKAYGYPAAAPFDGQSLESCSGKANNDPFNPQFNSQGINCNLTGGSSGGPWFIGTSASGYQNSVNSYGYGTNKMYGPYWGSVIESTYWSASAP